MKIKIFFISALFLLLSETLFAQEGSFWKEQLRNILIEKELDLLENMNATLGLQAGYFQGDTIYHISFDNPWGIGGHGESELEWPLANPLIGIFGSISYYREVGIDEKRDKAKLNLSWYTNITKDTGKKMKDSDWIENDVGYINTFYPGYPAWNNPGKDFFGELDTYLDKANIFEVSYLYNLFLQKKISIGLLAGWRYQKFEFYGKNLDQKGYGPYEQIINDWRATVSDETIASKWIEYEAKHQIPYLGIATELSLTEKFKLNIKFGYSDWVRIRDTDTHLYPDWDAANPGFDLNMISKSSCKGEAYLGAIEGIWRFLPNWNFGIEASYINIDTKGTLRQSRYLNGFLISEADGIDDKVTSEYWLIKGAIRYTF